MTFALAGIGQFATACSSDVPHVGAPITPDAASGSDAGSEAAADACACGGRECGDDGCGTSCGTCAKGFQCGGEGLCTADPLTLWIVQVDRAEVFRTGFWEGSATDPPDSDPPDPYAVVTVNGVASTTPVVSNTYAPAWLLALPPATVPELKKGFAFAIYDQDSFSGDEAICPESTVAFDDAMLKTGSVGWSCVNGGGMSRLFHAYPFSSQRDLDSRSCESRSRWRVSG